MAGGVLEYFREDPRVCVTSDPALCGAAIESHERCDRAAASQSGHLTGSALPRRVAIEIEGRICREAQRRLDGAREALYWLEIVEGSGLMTAEKLVSINQETNDLIAIFVSLIKKWKR
jgi:hypothetical protein